MSFPFLEVLTFGPPETWSPNSEFISPALLRQCTCPPTDIAPAGSNWVTRAFEVRAPQTRM